MSVREERIELAGGRALTCLRGGEGRPLLYLHGPSHVFAADPVVAALAEHFAVVAPVQPGFRDAAELAGLDDVRDLALHYDDLLDTLGLDAVAVAGHSFGGMVAAELAAHVPSRVETLVLAAPLGLWSDEHPPADLAAAFPEPIQPLLWADPLGAAAQAYAAAAVEADGDPAAGADGFVLRLFRSLPGQAKFTWPLPDKGLARRLYRVRARTLLLWGGADAVVPPAHADLFRALIPAAALEVLAGAGHMLPVEQRDWFVRRVADFTAGTPGR